MGMDDEPVWLTYADAAKRVKRDHITIRRWSRQGMPMEWRTDEIGQRYRVANLDVLLAWWRQTMTDSPVHFYKTRRKLIEAGGDPTARAGSVQRSTEHCTVARFHARTAVPGLPVPR